MYTGYAPFKTRCFFYSQWKNDIVESKVHVMYIQHLPYSATVTAGNSIAAKAIKEKRKEGMVMDKVPAVLNTFSGSKKTLFKGSFFTPLKSVCAYFSFVIHR